MDQQLSQETSFNPNLKQAMLTYVQKLMQTELDKLAYDHNEAQSKTNQICDKILRHLTSQNKNFKYIVNCLLMQKAECGLNISGSCYWDNDSDGSLTVKHETESMIGIVNVFACAL